MAAREGEVSPQKQIMYALYARAAMEPDFPCWLVGEDESIDYCIQCAQRRHASGEGECIGGGWGPAEGDTCVHCNDCGAVLSYWLTTYGVESELEHFRWKRFRNPIGPEEAFHLARLIDSAPMDRRVKRLALRAAKAPTPPGEG
jgi:hypothetical protein